jgi:DNA (cytosine-5)-methyltransferase 1
MHFYNEFDPKAAAWLRELIAQGHLPPGVVDERSIEDIEPRELQRYVQCHFFAGIGGWPLALQLAGWPTDRPVWTGSCPCQPFSAAGKGDGFADERHLWPAFHWLIQQCRPAVVLGEQVASAAVGPWVDLVFTDLEAVDYAVGAYAGPAAGVGTPHLRDRTYWVGFATSQRRERFGGESEHGFAMQAVEGDAFRLADAEFNGSRREAAAADHRQQETDRSADQHGGHCGASVRLGDAIGAASERDAGSILGAETAVDPTRLIHGRVADGLEHAGAGMGPRGAGPVNGHWRAADWLGCQDGKWRPVEPGTFPLAHGLPARVGRLRGYGNAIVPQQAEQFVGAVMEIIA